MKKLLNIILILNTLYSINCQFIAETRNVNLDLPPNERWSEIVTEFKEPLQHTLYWIKKESWIFKPIINELKSALKKNNGWTRENIKEMEGIALTSNISYDIIETANLFFEWDPGCTSIIGQKLNNEIIHGRNFDMAVSGLSNITLQYNFIKNGKTIYIGTGFVGYIGLINAMKPYQYSISVNSRVFQGDHYGKLNLLENIHSANRGGKPIGTFVRDMIVISDNYNQVIEKINNTVLIDVAYYIIAGVDNNQASVITRNRYNIDSSKGIDNGIWTLDTPNYWWRVETNFDHWWWAFDHRRETANEMLENIGQHNFSINTLLEVLSTPPVLAKTSVFTALMSPVKNMYLTIIR